MDHYIDGIILIEASEVETILDLLITHSCVRGRETKPIKIQGASITVKFLEVQCCVACQDKWLHLATPTTEKESLWFESNTNAIQKACLNPVGKQINNLLQTYLPGNAVGCDSVCKCGVNKPTFWSLALIWNSQCIICPGQVSLYYVGPKFKVICCDKNWLKHASMLMRHISSLASFYYWKHDWNK